MGCITSKEPLESCTLENTPKISFSGKAKVLSVHDGDTCSLAVPLGTDGITFRLITCRLYGIDTAEISKVTHARASEEIKVGLKAKEYLENRVLNKVVSIEAKGHDSRGRDVLATIFLDGVDINEEMLKTGFGYRYYGGKKRVFEDWYLGKREEEKEWMCCGKTFNNTQCCSDCGTWTCTCEIRHRKTTKMCGKCHAPLPEDGK